MTQNQVVQHQEQTAVATADLNNGIFGSVASFEVGQRMARALSASDLVPQAYKGNVANCAIALDVAMRMKLSPMTVLQSLHVIHGRPSWSAQFIISAINASGIFSPLRFEWRGAEGSDDRACRAWAVDLKSQTQERCFGPWVSMKMAKDEGWSTKAGSKWKTMPEQMMMYRAGAFFGRIYAGHLLAGMTMTREEIVDMGDADVVTEPVDGGRHAATVDKAAAVSELEQRVAASSRKGRKRQVIDNAEVVDVDANAQTNAQTEQVAVDASQVNAQTNAQPEGDAGSQGEPPEAQFF